MIISRILVSAAIGLCCPSLTARAENYLCRQQFALCTSAPCIPEPGNPKVAICTCDVEDGPSLATVACDSVKPSTDANGTTNSDHDGTHALCADSAADLKTSDAAASRSDRVVSAPRAPLIAIARKSAVRLVTTASACAASA